MKADTIIIGSGISGLTCAALHAQKGKKVIVLEKNKKAGGALKRFKRNGIPFDVGFHYTGGLGKEGILRILWEYLNVLPELSIRPFPSHGHDQVNIKDSDRIVRCFFSYDLLQKELQRVFPNETGAIQEYLETIQSICSEIPFFNLDVPLTPFLRNCFGPFSKALATVLNSLTRDEELLAVLATPAFLHGIPPANVSIATHAIVAHAYYSGAYAIDGGGQAIVDAFLAVLEKAGATVETSCEAQQILVDSEGVRGVRTPDQEIRAPEVVYTGHPTHLLDIIGEEVFRPAYCTRLRDLKNTGSMFIVFAEAKYPGAAEKTTWINYYSVPKGMDILDVPEKNPERSSLMLTAPGRRDSDAGLSRAGRGVIVIRPADWRETERFKESKLGSRPKAYECWKKEQTENIVTEVDRMWGDIVGEIQPLAAGSPLTFRDELSTPEGGVYGVQHSMNQFIAGARTRVPGLWLSGQGTLMTGLMGASLSGLVTAGEMLGLEKLWDEVRQCR